MSEGLPYLNAIQLFTHIKLPMYAIHDHEWKPIEYIIISFEAFENATKILSGIYYRSTHLALYFINQN